MLDRTISGAGGLTDLADRAIRPITERRSGNPLATRPGSVIVAVLLGLLAALLVLAGLEVADDPTPRTLAAAVVMADPGLGDRVYATVDGSVSFDYVETFIDMNGNGEKDPDEISTEWFYFLVDPVSNAGVTVRSSQPPDKVVNDALDLTPATFTGMLRRDERAASEAKSTSGLDVGDLGLEISARYVLDDGTSPANPFLAFGLAAAGGLLAGTLLVGLSGGYLIYRPSPGPLPEPRTTLGIGERLPLKVTGVLRTTTGLVHVREAPADLVRFPTTSPVTSSDGVVPDPASTLIIERRGRAEGVAVGLGQLVRITSGTALPFRGSQPALRAVAGTGPLLLSFEGEVDRDRAAAELLDETGLGTGGDTTEQKES